MHQSGTEPHTQTSLSSNCRCWPWLELVQCLSNSLRDLDTLMVWFVPTKCRGFETHMVCLLPTKRPCQVCLLVVHCSHFPETGYLLVQNEQTFTTCKHSCVLQLTCPVGLQHKFGHCPTWWWRRRDAHKALANSAAPETTTTQQVWLPQQLRCTFGSIAYVVAKTS